MTQSTENATKIISGAEILLKSLEAEGVEYIFGIPGGIVLPIYDVFHDTTVKHILTKHEQGAVHAAEGYAKSTGKVGVALTTSGPGATNIVTGITDAYYDSVPIVVFTGNVSNVALGNDAFQESDIVGITRSCTKHNFSVRDVKDLAVTVKEAFHIAASGRPGPVLVDITRDAIIGKCAFNYPEKINLLGYNPNYKIDQAFFSQIMDDIQKAKKPVILCGGGVVSSNSIQELTSISEKFDIPVASTLMGLGGFPGSHKNFIGFSGMHGKYWTNIAIHDCDLLIILGSRLSDRQTGVTSKYAPNAKIIHIDIDPVSLNKNITANTLLLGNIKEILALMLKKSALIHYSEQQKEERKLWWKQILDLKQETIANRAPNDTEYIRPSELIRKVYELSDENAIICTEVGQHQMWSAQFFNKNNARSFITSGGLGTMGFGYPASIGAQLANPDKQVITIAGDGSFQMNLQEIATTVVYDIPVKVIVVNNGYLGMVRQWQGYMFDRYSESKLFSPDYELMAQAYGIKGFRIEKREDLESKLKEALAHPGPVIVDCLVEGEDDVFPWVPVGNSNKEMLTEDQ